MKYSISVSSFVILLSHAFMSPNFDFSDSRDFIRVGGDSSNIDLLCSCFERIEESLDLMSILIDCIESICYE